MIRISYEKALSLHTLLCRKTGGDDGLRDGGLLDAALNQPYQSFGGEDLYKSIEEKAARLGYSLISNHPFVDGNKRIGMLLMLTMLRLANVKINTTSKEIARVGFALASGRMNYEDLLDWIKQSR